jgi:hypothetical protein
LYGIDPSVAFHLWRPILAQKIRQYDGDQAIQAQKQKLLKGLAVNDKSGNFQDNEKSTVSMPKDNVEGNTLTIDNDVLDPQKSKKEITPPSQVQT